VAKDLQHFLEKVKKELPGDYVEVTRPVNPDNFDVTAILEHLTQKKKLVEILLY